jgi:hypothetical protein
VKKKTIPATGNHQWGEIDIYEEPDCMNKGYGDQYCDVCYERKEIELPVDKNAHDWTNWETYTKATALKSGKKVRYCYVCDKEEYKTIAKLKASVKLQKTSLTLKKKKSYTLKTKSITYGDKVSKWTTSNKKIATVSSNGKITGKKKGKATITLYMKSGAKATCKVTVK